MPNFEIFQFFLKKGNLFYTVQDGSVVLTPTETPLKKSPNGWEETEIKWTRHPIYRGVIRSATDSPYEFEGDGAKILRFVYFTEGIDGECTLAIKKLQRTNLLYEDYYQGSIDFSQVQGNPISVHAGLKESGLNALINAYQDTMQEVALANDADRVVLDGLTLTATDNYVPLGLTISNTNNMGVLVPSAFITQDGDYPIGLQNGQTPMAFDALGPGVPNAQFDNYLFRSTRALTCQFTINMQVLFSNPGTNTLTTRFQLMLVRVNSSQNIVSRIDVVPPIGPGSFADCPIGGSQLLTVSRTVGTFSLVSGDRLYLVALSSIGVVTTMVITGNPLTSTPYYFHLYSKFKLDTTLAKIYRLYVLLQKVTSALSGGLNTSVSTFLSNPSSVPAPGNWDNVPYNTTVTCGDALRNLATGTNGGLGSTGDAKIKTSLSELFRSIRAIWPVGLGVENEQLILEHISYFFDPYTEIADLGEVSEFEWMPMDGMGNSINVGYPNQTYDNLNGRDEFNNTTNYRFPIVKEPNPIDWTAKYRADMYGIEYTRANLAQKTTTDSSSDNDTFLITISNTLSGSGAYTLYRPQLNPGASVSGLLFSNDAFNIDLTPTRNALRNGTKLRIYNHLKDGLNITFQTTDKNASLVSNLGSGNVTENADIPVSSLPPPPHLPIILMFKKSLPNLSQLMATYPKGYFRFTYNGREFKGFIDNVGVKPAHLDTYEFRLLAHPDSDLSAFL